MTDLHIHILPGVDDGSPNLSTSLEMAEIAAKSGVRILAVTPHANQTGIEGVEQEIRKEHIPISLVRGMEIMSIGPLNEKIKERKLIPLHESRYYLIEVPFDMAPDGIRRRLMEFPAMGKIPVLAHPERYFCVQDSPELLYEFREMGAVLQMNKRSRADSTVSAGKPSGRLCGKRCPPRQLPDTGHETDPGISVRVVR